MSTKHLDERITTRYGEPEKDIYRQVIDLVKKNSIAKSRAQLLLVKRGLAHMGNPEPLIKEKVVYRDREVPVEKIKTVIKEMPVEKVVYRSPPKVDKPTQEHVAMDDHITDEYIGGDHEFEQRPSGDIRTTQDKAVSSPNTALDVKKSPKADSNGNLGWKIAGGLGVASVLIGLGYKIWSLYH